jgi:hypothetical protein
MNNETALEVCIAFTSDEAVELFSLKLELTGCTGHTVTRIAADVRGMVAEMGFAVYNGWEAEVAADTANSTCGARVVNF